MSEVSNFCLFDFEATNSDPKLLKDGGAWRYSEDLLTEILCLVFYYRGKIYYWRPGKAGPLLRKLAADRSVTFIRQGDFELAMWRNMMVPNYGFPELPLDRWHDVMSSAATKALPLSLEDLCEALSLPLQKDTEGRKFTLGLSKPDKAGHYDRSAASIQRVVKYCRRDVEATLTAHKRLGFLPAEELPAFRLHQEMNVRGLRIDRPYVGKAQEVVDKESKPLLARFAELTGGLKPTQRDKVLDWCSGHGAELPDLTKETVANALGGSIDATDEDDELDGPAYELTDEVRQALEIRQLIGSSSVKKLGRMLACVCEDGRARGLSQFHGTAPGRSAGRLFQPYNFPRGVLQDCTPDQVVDAIMTGDPAMVEILLGAPPIQAVVSGLRHAIVPDPGNVFLSGDYAGIQARIVLALSGQHDRAELMAAGKDVYCDMASAIYRRPITKADKDERHIGKNSVLGLGFGMGWQKFKLKYGKHLSDEFCQEVVRVYRKEWAPEVPRLWYALADASLLAVETGQTQEAYGIEYRRENGWLTARLPSGRKLYYWNPQPCLNRYDRPSWTYQAFKDGQSRTVDTFGGQLCENVVMGIEVDIQRHGWANAERNGFPIVLECYDELVAEVEEWADDQKGFEQCLLDVPRWVKDLRIPVAVEGWSGYRYRKA
jgi:DNA polymerase bacteriophage-type